MRKSWIYNYSSLSRPLLSLTLSFPLFWERPKPLSMLLRIRGGVDSYRGGFGKKATSVRLERTSLFLSVERLSLGQQPSALSPSHWNDCKPTRRAPNHPTDNSCWVPAVNEGCGSTTNGGRAPRGCMYSMSSTIIGFRWTFELTEPVFVVKLKQVLCFDSYSAENSADVSCHFLWKELMAITVT